MVVTREALQREPSYVLIADCDDARILHVVELGELPALCFVAAPTEELFDERALRLEVDALDERAVGVCCRSMRRIVPVDAVDRAGDELHHVVRLREAVDILRRRVRRAVSSIPDRIPNGLVGSRDRVECA